MLLILTSDILDLYLWDRWPNTLSCSPLTYDIYGIVLNYLTCTGITCLCVSMLSISFSMHVFRYRFNDTHVFTWFRIYYRSFNFLYVTCHCRTCMPEPHHLIMYTCDCLCTLIGFILRIRLVIFWQSWTFVSIFRSLNHGGLTIAVREHSGSID